MMKRRPACQPLASAQSRRSASENTLRLPLTILAGSGNGLRQQLDTDKSDRLPARWLELLKDLDEAGARQRQPLPGPQNRSFRLATSVRQPRSGAQRKIARG